MTGQVRAPTIDRMGLRWSNIEKQVGLNALRRLDLVGRTAEDVGGAEFDCEGGVCYPSGEPAGIWADGPDRLPVADTNNRRIVEVRPRTRTVRTLFA